MDFETVAEVYRQTNSIKQTAKLLSISEVKVRRILITCGLWQSQSSMQIGDLYRQGFSVKEISQQLFMSEKNVQAYLPYTRGTYRGPSKSAEAIRSEVYRLRNKNAFENQVTHAEPNRFRIENTETTGKGIIMETNINVLKLHLELFLDHPDPRELGILKKYAKVEKGITRDVLVPDTMTLHALHYAIQKAFGWQNSHLHHFSLPEEIFQMCTQGAFCIWTKLCGVYFRFPIDDLSDLYWDDDYNGRISVNTWLKRKYCGPYRYEGSSENYIESQIEVRDFYRRWPKVEIHRPWNEWGEDYENRIEKIIDPKDATIDEVFRSLVFESSANCMLERLTLREIMCPADQIPDSIDPYSVAVCPLTDRLVYEYDYGDGWVVHISLVDSADVTPEQTELVQTEKPVCVARDGINIMDDVGGVYGFCEFLEQLHEGEPEEQEQLHQWSKMFAWTGRAVKPEKIL